MRLIIIIITKSCEHLTHATNYAKQFIYIVFIDLHITPRGAVTILILQMKQLRLRNVQDHSTSQWQGDSSPKQPSTTPTT